jgi:hypothetical protein
LPPGFHERANPLERFLSAALFDECHPIDDGNGGPAGLEQILELFDAVIRDGDTALRIDKVPRADDLTRDVSMDPDPRAVLAVFPIEEVGIIQDKAPSP